MLHSTDVTVRRTIGHVSSDQILFGHLQLDMPRGRSWNVYILMSHLGPAGLLFLFILCLPVVRKFPDEHVVTRPGSFLQHARLASPSAPRSQNAQVRKKVYTRQYICPTPVRSRATENKRAPRLTGQLGMTQDGFPVRFTTSTPSPLALNRSSPPRRSTAAASSSRSADEHEPSCIS